MNADSLLKMRSLGQGILLDFIVGDIDTVSTQLENEGMEKFASPLTSGCRRWREEVCCSGHGPADATQQR